MCVIARRTDDWWGRQALGRQPCTWRSSVDRPPTRWINDLRSTELVADATLGEGLCPAMEVFRVKWWWWNAMLLYRQHITIFAKRCLLYYKSKPITKNLCNVYQKRLHGKLLFLLGLIFRFIDKDSSYENAIIPKKEAFSHQSTYW